MTVVCPSCGADGQEVGKFCENCGFFITADSLQAHTATPGSPTPSPTSPAPTASPQSPTNPTDPSQINDNGIGAPAAHWAAPPGSAQFAVVQNGKANPAEGFTITRTGEYLVGRTDIESGSQADIDVRQWVQPMDIHGQKQYLVHRKQCYIGLTADGKVTIRLCPGAEYDTLVKPATGKDFTPLATFGTIRNARPDSAYELEVGDRIYMGDPDALPFFQTNAPTAQGSYLVLELLPKPTA